MIIRYVGRSRSPASTWADPEQTVLLLHFDNWDDYGHKMRFPTTLLHLGEEVHVPALRIQIESELRAHDRLGSLLAEGWDGEFPLPSGVNYISVPEEITFYEQLASLLSPDELLAAAISLRDASYMTYVRDDPEARKLIETGAFSTSLQRERGSQKAFSDGWKIIQRQDFSVRNFSFTFRDPFDAMSLLDLKYETDRVLPRDINVLIGANGSGKTSLLRQMVHAWLEPDARHEALRGAHFAQKPNLSQLVAVTYSPFERLPVDIVDQALDHPLKDQDIYRFFGFRGREGSLKGSKARGIRNGPTVPKANASRSLLRCIEDDRRYRRLEGWSNKLETLNRVMGSAVAYDFPTLRLADDAPEDAVLPEHDFLTESILHVEEDDRVRSYVPVTSHLLDFLNLEGLARHLDADHGVTLFKNGLPVHLSSGQRLFFYIVVNVLGAIRRNSLILVDEPELFLHPTLEVQYLGMLKSVLSAYASKALIATHSAFVVREVPSDCVHILERTDEGLVIKQPPFETFGGDVQRITSYVFGDRAISKPFEAWLHKLLQEHGSPEAVLQMFGADVNEEVIIQLHAMSQSMGTEW